MNSKETKKCPYCCETIMAEAKKCKHCGEWIENDDVASTPSTFEIDCRHCDKKNLQYNIFDMYRGKHRGMYDGVYVKCSCCSEEIPIPNYENKVEFELEYCPECPANNLKYDAGSILPPNYYKLKKETDICVKCHICEEVINLKDNSDILKFF